MSRKLENLFYNLKGESKYVALNFGLLIGGIATKELGYSYVVILLFVVAFSHIVKPEDYIERKIQSL